VHFIREVLPETEAAKFFEWGGDNSDGSDGFSTMRPGSVKVEYVSASLTSSKNRAIADSYVLE
jgi:hypothetical protein